MQLRALPHRQKMYILAGVLLAMLLGALDNTIVGPAMPSIVAELGGMAMLSWVFTIYSLTSTIAIPIVGKLSDLYGRKRFYLAGIVIFLAGSALSGAAGEGWLNALFRAVTGADNAMLQLIAFRGLQGIGGGMMMANAMAIIGDLFDTRERGKYQGLTGAVFGLASVFGPMLGGWLTDALTWRWIFYINVPLGVLALVVLGTTMPQPEPGQRHAVDYKGALALTLGVVPLLLALNWAGSEHPWGSPMILGLLGAAVVGLGLFVVREMRADEPILDIALFSDRSFAASMVVLFLSGVGMFAAIMFLPTFMQVVLERSASNSGALLTPMMLAMITGSIITGQAISRTGRYKAFGLVGLALAALGMLLLSRITVETGNLALAVDMMLVGVGVGITMPLFTISLQSLFPTRIGEVTGALQFFRSIGGTFGVALLGGVMNATFASRLGALVSEHSPVFGSAAGQLATLAEDPGSLLNEGAMAAVAASLPAELQPALATFSADVQQALSTGIANAFFWGFVLMVLAFVAMWFVEEKPLHAKVHLDTPAEVGAGIFADEAVSPAEHEPVVVGDETAEGERVV